MRHFAIVDPVSLQVVSRYVSQKSLFDGGSYLHLEIPVEHQLHVLVATRNTTTGAIELREDPGATEQVKAEAWVVFRRDRDARLAASDWTMLPDVALANRDAWMQYRAALRALPEIVTDPETPTWPALPINHQ